MKKKLFSALLATLLLLTVIPLGALSVSAAGYNYTVRNGEVTITGYSGSANKLTIPSTLQGYPVTAIGENAFYYCAFSSVTIPDSVTYIGAAAFSACKNLISVTIPDSVTYIGDEAFRVCTSLYSVTIPKGVTSIGTGVFDYCKKLTSVTIPDSVTSIGYGAFWYCENLTSITIPSSVTSIGAEAFRGCNNLTSVIIPDSVTSIGYGAFYYCEKLTSVIIPDSVTNIGKYAFRGCNSLASVYYTGAESVKQDISIDYGNDCLENAVWYYNTQLVDGHVYDFVCDANCNICGATRVIVHNYAEATCTTPATCKDCGVISGSVLDHTYNDVCDECCDDCGATRTPPHTYDNACDTECNACGNTRATTHSYMSATCTTAKKCRICGSTEGDALGHSYTNVIVSPTCVAEGKTVHTCSRCGDYYDTDWTPMIEHDYAPATCTEPMTCKGCGKLYGQSLGHTYDDAEGLYCTVCFMPRTKSCDVCDGAGEITSLISCDVCEGDSLITKKCSSCNGSGSIKKYGTIRCISCRGSGQVSERVTCSSCRGSKGYYACGICGGIVCFCPASISKFYPCTSCKGTGTETRPVDCRPCGGSGETTGLYSTDCKDCDDGNVFESCTHCIDGTIYTTLTCPHCDGLKETYCKPDAPVLWSVTANSVVLVSVPHCEYSKDGITWQDSPTFKNLSSKKEYHFYQRFKKTDKVSASDPSEDLVILTHNHTYTNDCDSNCDLCDYYRGERTHLYRIATCITPKRCTVCGVTEGEALGHIYTNGCDADCDVCGFIRENTGHNWANGNCTICGEASPTKAVITAEPTTGYAKMGEKVTAKVAAEGEGLTYTWYIKNAGSSKYSKSSVTKSSYSVTMSDKVKDRLVFCRIYDQYGNMVQSKTVRLREAASINKEPATAAYAQMGKKVSVKITASGDGLTYAWYIKNEGGSKYSKSSVTSATYSTTMSDKAKNRRVYCVVKDKYGKTVQSKTFLLRESVSITTQPKTVSVAKNKTAKVTVKASGDGLKYTWYIKNANGTKYSKSSVTSATYSVKMSSKANGRRLYCIVTDKYGNKVQTQTVILKKK